MQDDGVTTAVARSHAKRLPQIGKDNAKKNAVTFFPLSDPGGEDRTYMQEATKGLVGTQLGSGNYDLSWIPHNLDGVFYSSQELLVVVEMSFQDLAPPSLLP